MGITIMSSEDSYPPKDISAPIKKLPERIQKGCGNEEYFCEEKGATFLGGKMPDELPDLSKHSSFLTDALKENPDLYKKLKDKKTKLGVTLGHCIKTGIDNPGHPMIKTCGLVAGDEECFELFAEVFDPVISARHNGYAADAKHPTDLDVSKLSDTKIDPTGKYTLTSRCRTGRSVRGFRLPPCCSFEERREIEKVVVNGLLSLEDDLKGDYFPLHGSRSYEPKPTGMTVEKEEELRKNGNLFQEPDSTLLLSSGCGRHWPDARGIFHNEAQNFFVWVNEEDQMRIVSMQKGASVVEIFNRFSAATEGIQKVLKKEGYDFMQTLAKMGLQARGTGGVDSASTGGTWDISNADRLGKSETQLVNIFIEGVAQIIQWEQKLEAGENIDAEWNAAALPAKY